MNKKLAGVFIPACCIAFFGFHLRSDAQRVPAAGGESVFRETMADMTWPEVEKAAGEGAVVLMAPAVIEEHGPQLVCGTDTYIGYQMCVLIRRELSKQGVTAVIAPPYFWGINQSTSVFPGTFTVRPETMKALLGDFFASIKRMGFRRIFALNPHGDSAHNRALIEAILEAEKNLGLEIRYFFSADDAKEMGLTGPPPSWILLYQIPSRRGLGPSYPDFHAGAFETGVMAAFFPGLVKAELARTLKPARLSTREVGEWAKDPKKLTPLGYVGDPAGYDAAKAKAFLEEWCRNMASAAAELIKKSK